MSLGRVVKCEGTSVFYIARAPADISLGFLREGWRERGGGERERGGTEGERMEGGTGEREEGWRERKRERDG